MRVHKRVTNFLSDSKFNLIFKGGVLSLLTRIIAVLIGFGTNILITRVYGVETLGLLAILNSILMLATIISLAGMDSAVLKLIPKYSTKNTASATLAVYKKSLLLTTFFSSICAILLFYSSEIIANDVFNKPILAGFIPFVALAVVLKSYAKINLEIVRSFKKIKLYCFMILLPSVTIIMLLIGIGSIYFDPYLPIYIYLFSTIIIVFCGGGILKITLKNSQNNTIVSVKKILSISLPMMLTASLFFFSTQMDTLMLGVLSSTSNVGIYSVDIRLATLVIFVNGALNAMMTPKISELYHSGDTAVLKYIITKSTSLIFWLTLPLCIIIILFGEYFLSIFGEEFIISYTALVLLTIGQMVNSLVGPNGTFLNMTGHHKQLMYIILMSTIINIILNSLLIPLYGINGAAFATMTSQIIWNLTATVYIKYKCGFLMFFNPFNLQRA